MPKPPFTFWFANFGWFSDRTASTVDDAKRVARDIGFEVGIYDANEDLIGTWSPITGWQDYPKSV